MVSGSARIVNGVMESRFVCLMLLCLSGSCVVCVLIPALGFDVKIYGSMQWEEVKCGAVSEGFTATVAHCDVYKLVVLESEMGTFSFFPHNSCQGTSEGREGGRIGCGQER